MKWWGTPNGAMSVAAAIVSVTLVGTAVAVLEMTTERFACERLLEGLTDQQLELYADQGRLPEPLPEPLPRGGSRLDRLDRKSLIRLWEAHEREFEDRTEQELSFYCAHGHWLAQS